LKPLTKQFHSDYWNKHSLKDQIWAWDDEQIIDFVANEIDVVVMPFGTILTYPTILKSPLLSKWSNQK